MRRSGPGATGSGRSTRTSCAVVVRRPGDKWHLGEVFVQINGAQRYLWRAVDQHANVLDILVQSRRNVVAAKKFFRRLLKGPAVGAQGDRHRQACPLAGAAPRARAVGDPSPVEVPEQPRRELPSADPATRAGDETLQVDPARATVPVGVQRHLAALWAPSAPAVGGRLPTGDGRPLRGLERDHRGDDHGRRLNRRLGQDVSSKPRLITPNHHIGQLGWLKLTVPLGGDADEEIVSAEVGGELDKIG